MAFPASPSARTATASAASVLPAVASSCSAGPSPGPESEPTPVLAILEAENETVFFAGRRRLRLPSIAALLDGGVAPSSSSSSVASSSSACWLLLTQLKRYLLEELALTARITAEEEDNNDTAGKNTYDALQLEVYDTRHQLFVPLGSSSVAASHSDFNNDHDKMMMEEEEKQQQRSRIVSIFTRRCCRLRLSSTPSNSMHNNNEAAVSTKENTPFASSLLALPWREFVTVPVPERFQYTCPRASAHALYFPVPQTTTTIAIAEVSNTPAVQTSGTLWDGAVRLMQFVAYHSSSTTTTTKTQPRPNPWYSVRHKTILEVGAGTGLVGLAAGHALHAHRVVVTDLPIAVPNLRRNLAQNTTRAVVAAEKRRERRRSTRRSHITAQVLDWCDFTTCDAVLSFVDDDGDRGPGGDMNPVVTLAKSTPTTWIPDLILAADVIWVEALVLPFVRTLHRICSQAATSATGDLAAAAATAASSSAPPPRPLILLAYQRRSLRVETVLFQTLHDYSFQYEDVTTTTSTTLLPVSKIRIYCLRWSPKNTDAE